MAEGYKTIFVPREQYNIVVNELERLIAELDDPMQTNSRYRLAEQARQSLIKAKAMEIEFNTI
jgi:hypothetical protein